MGGTIARLIHQGHRVTLLDMTDGCPTPRGDRPTRLAEASAAAGELGFVVQAGRPARILLDLPNRMVEHSLEARHKVAGVIRAVQANIIFLPHPEDAHPDHVATTRIVEDARFDAKLTKIDMPAPAGVSGGQAPIYPKWLIYYYCSHLRSVPAPTFIMDTSGYEAAKQRAILAYKSQFVDNEGNRSVPEWIFAQDRYFGSRIGTQAGEAFWMREPMGLRDLAFT